MKSVVGPSSIRKIKSLRGRSKFGSRSEHGDDNIPLDLTRDPNDILKEILMNVCSQQAIATSRKLGHLNNFVKLLCSIADDSLIEIPMEVIMTCLKATLVSDVKEVRAAGVRALRYLINDNETKQIFMNLRLDYLITKCLDISHFNEVERIQAIRLVRKLAHLKPQHASKSQEPIVPLSLFAGIVSVSLGGAEERDRVYRTCLAVLCELAVIQPWLVLRCNGVLALINAVLECHMYGRISECLCMALMHLINHPSASVWHKPDLNVGAIFAPYTELNYRLHPDVEDSKLKEEQEMRYAASKMAIVSLLRTWSGLFHVCHSKDMIRSFVEALLIPTQSVRRGILAVLCDLFYLNELEWTDDFDAALRAAAPGNFKDNWRLSEGFVVAEGKCLLPVRAVARPDLVDCHLSVLLSCFLQAGLLKCLTTVCLSTDRHSSIAATIVLGTVLHLACRLLPSDDGSSSWQWHLPELLCDNSTDVSLEEKHRRNVTVKQLQEIHMLLNKASTVHSLYLAQLLAELPQARCGSPRRTSFTNLTPSPSHSRSGSISFDPLSSGTFSILKRHRSLNLIRDFTEEHTLAAVKNTKVLATKENSDWDWDALQCLFVSPPSALFLRGVGTDDTLRRFYRRLIYFYQPSSKLFSAIDLSKHGMPDQNRKFVSTACHMVQFLAHSDEEGQRLLKNLISAIVESLPETGNDAVGYSKAAGSLAVTCSREYFLILGALSCDRKGDPILGHCKAYHYFLGLASDSTHENLIKLLVSSLHYTEDSPSRAVLAKVLTTCNEAGRLYGTGFLRVLLRSNCPGFQRWGTELLTTQLFDKSNEVASEALDILHEACDDRNYLRSVVQLRPTLLHLGERGAILVCRFLSEPQGFAYLTQNHYLTRELDRWWKQYNERYVLHVEELLKLSLTTYERPNKDEGFVRRSGYKKDHQSVYLPAHLYGELCRHEEGANLLEREQITSRLTITLRALIAEDKPDQDAMQKEHARAKTIDTARLLKMKSCLWALAHIGSTARGLPLLQKYDTLPLLNELARESRISSIRGTCLYCLSCIAQTIPGVEALRDHGWKSVLRTVSSLGADENKNQSVTPEPLITPRMTRGNLSNKSISSSSQWSTASSPSHASNRRSPRGSVGTLSTCSDKVKERSSRSRTSSRTVASDPGSSFKSKSRRNSKKHSVQDEQAFLPSPSNTSVSVVSSRSSISEADLTNSCNATIHNLTTTSPTRKYIDPIQVDTSSKFSTNQTLDRRRSTDFDNNTSTHSLTDGKKSRSRTVFDFIFKKGRTKSLNKHSLDRKRQPDDTSSGYASDHLSLEQQEVNFERTLIEDSDEPPPSPVLSHKNGRLLSSATLTSSSSLSVDTIKTVETGKPFMRDDNGKRKSSVFAVDKEVDVAVNGRSMTNRTAVAAWNTNNSGQTESVLTAPDADGVTGRSQFYVAQDQLDTLKRVERVRCVRTQSLPNVHESPPVADKIDNRRSWLAQNHDTSKFLMDLTMHDDGLPNGVPESGEITDPPCSRTRSYSKQPHTDRQPAVGAALHRSQIVALDPIQERLRNGNGDGDVSLSKRTAAKVTARSVSVPNPAPCEFSNRVRGRDDARMSQDSGMDNDLSSAHAHQSNLQLTGVVSGLDRSCLEMSPEDEDSHWRTRKPTGLAAVRLFNQRPTSPISTVSRRSYHEQSDVVLDKISIFDRDDIINTTRYVGIAIPESLPTFLQPSSKSTSRKEKQIVSLLSSLEENCMKGDSAETNPGKQKVIDLLQGRKFRGLDEYTFGPAVAAALKAGNKSRNHSAVNTPCARTPDSMLSEASDLCYVGGQPMDPGSEEYVAILHQEVIQLVVNLGSSVGIKAHETALLMMKEKRPDVFDSISLYNSIVQIMSEYCFRLTTRRFVQELFQDVHFTEVYQEAQRAVQGIQ